MAVLRQWWQRLLERRQARRQRWIESQAINRRDLLDAHAERWRGVGPGGGGV
jgi:hypothetical protein